jgi:hypothetical protein
MTSLLSFARKLRADAKQTTPDLPVGTLTFSTPYTQLRYAEVEGIGTVEIDYSGNMIGFSPVERCTHNGETAWIPLELCRNIRLQPFVKATKAPKAAD